jgi:hypothetical protein
MSTKAPTPAARLRKVRTRTKIVSNRPPLALSDLPVTCIDLTPGMEQLVCADCSTWCPITGVRGATPKLVPHHTERAGSPNPRRCIGTNRRVILNLTHAEWAKKTRRFIEALDADSRRSARQHYKPIPAPPPATSQMAGRPRAAASPKENLAAIAIRARRALVHHVTACADCTFESQCPVGETLVGQLRRLADSQKSQVEQADRDEEQSQRVAAENARERGLQWKVIDAKGEVQAADEARRPPAGAISHYRGPHVPQVTLTPRPKAKAIA